MDDRNKKRSNKYFDWLVQEAQTRHLGETFTLSHDRARLVPSYASIDLQQQPIPRTSNNIQQIQTKHTVESNSPRPHILKSHSFPKRDAHQQTTTTAVAVPLTVNSMEEQTLHEKEWTDAMAMTYIDPQQQQQAAATAAGKEVDPTTFPRRLSSSSSPPHEKTTPGKDTYSQSFPSSFLSSSVGTHIYIAYAYDIQYKAHPSCFF